MKPIKKITKDMVGQIVEGKHYGSCISSIIKPIRGKIIKCTNKWATIRLHGCEEEFCVWSGTERDYVMQGKQGKVGYRWSVVE